MDILRVRKVIEGLSLQEKISLLGCDASLLSRAILAPKIFEVNFSTDMFFSETNLLALGSSFDKELAFNLGKLSSENSRKNNYCLSGKISLGVIREPFKEGAENFLSEEPLIVEELAEKFIDGAGARVCGTDFLGGEYAFKERYIDERALYEIYLKPLINLGKKLAAVEIPSGTLNGNIVCEDNKFIKTLLSFLPSHSLVLNKPFSVLSTDKAVVTSAIFEMCDNKKDKILLYSSVVNGSVDERKIDLALERSIKFIADYYEDKKVVPKPFVQVYDTFKNLAEKSIILLKNVEKDNIKLLPLKRKNELETTRYISACGDIILSDFCKFNLNNEFELLKKPSECGDITVVFADCKTGKFSRTVNENIAELKKLGKKVILIIIADRPFVLSEMINADAIFYVPKEFDLTYEILEKMIFADINPSGKLSISWAKKEEDYPSNLQEVAKKRGMFCYESVYNGYRYFSSFNKEIEFCFGHGLSYLEPTISDVKYSYENDCAHIDFTLKNTSAHGGDAVLFVFDSGTAKNVYGLKMRLVGFSRVQCSAEGEQRVHITIPLERFKYFNVGSKLYENYALKHMISIGFSANDIVYSNTLKFGKLTKKTDKKSEEKIVDNADVKDSLSSKNIPSYYDEKNFKPLGIEIEKVMKVPLITKANVNLDYVTKVNLSDNKRDIKLCYKKLSKITKANINVENLSKAMLKKIIDNN